MIKRIVRFIVSVWLWDGNAPFRFVVMSGATALMVCAGVASPDQINSMPSFEHALQSRQKVEENFDHMTFLAADAVLCSSTKSCMTAMLGTALSYQQ